jgi:hypothetical protein
MCEDFPCCGHESGCCPDYDESGKQINMICTCGAILPIDNRYSICDDCMNEEDYEEEDYEDFDDVDADADTLASAGWGTDEDYGYYEEPSYDD